MTYVNPDPETTKGDIDFHVNLDDVETLINKAVSRWLREQRLEIYLMDGHIVVFLEDAFADNGERYTYRIPYAEFFDERNEEPPDLTQFLLFGLKVYRERYGHDPVEDDA
jgi:hypothetical protein